MPIDFDAVVIGGGHNGLITAAYLAKAGIRTLIVEKLDRIGGCATSESVASGFVVPALAHRVALAPTIVRDLQLERLGLQIIQATARVCAPTLDGRALTLWTDERAAAHEIAAFSRRDAARYPEFLASMAAVSRVLNRLLAAPPPQLNGSVLSNVRAAVRAGRAFRALGRPDAHRLLRWLPMSVQDLVSEWFESEPLRVTVASDGTFGAYLGSRSAGSAAQLLLLGASQGCPIAPGWTVRGGPGAVVDTLANAARQAGVEILTGRRVRAITVRNDTATGVVLSDGVEVNARVVASSADPKRTLLELIQPGYLTPDVLQRVRNIRARGMLAKVNFAVSELPDFSGLTTVDPQARSAALSGCIRLSDSLDAHERAFDEAKRGELSSEPWIELAIPSILDRSLTPPGKHVVSCYVQFAPRELKHTTWDVERDRLAALVIRRISMFAPGFESLIVAQHVITPLDLEQTYGLSGGHIFHGELALDQILLARPYVGWDQYRGPIGNLYLCGCGVHPGTGFDGRSGRLAARQIVKDRRAATSAPARHPAARSW